MKSLDWHKWLESQHTVYGKVLYTVTELAHAAGCTRSVLNVELSRLQKLGIITRCTHGVYGKPGEVSAEELLPHLDKRAYITGEFALSYHALITQHIHRITCFTNRRHNRSRVRETPVGTYEFITVSSSIYMPPKKSVIAEPEQAFLDYIYITRRQGLLPRSLVTLRKLHTLRQTVLSQLASGYPATVKLEAQKL